MGHASGVNRALVELEPTSRAFVRYNQTVLIRQHMAKRQWDSDYAIIDLTDAAKWSSRWLARKFEDLRTRAREL